MPEINIWRGDIMAVYLCKICKLYVYDEYLGDQSIGIAPETPYSSISDTWRCPICSADKNSLEIIPEDQITKVKERFELHIKNQDKPNPQLTLLDVRKNALEKLKGICTVNKVCDGQPIRFCMGQKYGAPLGLGAAGKGLAFTANVQALDKIKLKQRLITDHAEPKLGTTIFKKEISLPIMASSLSGVKASMGGKLTEKEFAYSVLKGCLDFGTIGFIGNTSDDNQELTGVQMVKEVGSGIPIFKPQKNERLLQLIKMAEESGAVAVGVDLDGVGSTNWERAGKPVYRKNMIELRELVDSTELPFIAKSIMSVADAEAAVDAGVAGIDVSNHGGRILDSTLGVAEVLPKIVKAVQGKVTITAGGGVRTGFDVLKMLALGANGVLIGRDIVRAAIGGGVAGVKLHLGYLKSDLRRGMLMTSCNRIEDIDQKIIEEFE
jgi:isopentenyl diphosphate isomerase/L-lactate dehydrogenase-like FMN-dependent dehydrogenase/rubredoxin